MRWPCLVVATVVACGMNNQSVSLAAPTEKETLVELIAQSAEFDKQRELFDRAQQLERDGEEERAFVAYLALDGAESLAMRIARPRAKDYLEVLRREAKSIPAARRALIEADLLLATGEKEKALERLEKCYEDQDPNCWNLKVEPFYDSLRTEPRFQALLKKVGLDK